MAKRAQNNFDKALRTESLTVSVPVASVSRERSQLEGLSFVHFEKSSMEINERQSSSCGPSFLTLTLSPDSCLRTFLLHVTFFHPMILVHDEIV
jgi:hypothetical protein